MNSDNAAPNLKKVSTSDLQEAYRALRQIINVWDGYKKTARQPLDIQLVNTSYADVIEKELERRGARSNVSQLHPKQRDILKYLETYQGEHGISPSVDTIAKGLKISSTSVVHYHLSKLRDQGYISSIARTGHSIKVLKPSEA